MRNKPSRDFGPTQKDIADALGLAQSTVATALNPETEHRLLAKTAEQIKAYAKKVGYRPQRFAQIMRGERTRVIGVIVRLGVYFSHHELVRKLANALNRSGYRLVMVDIQWFDGNLEAVCNYLLDQAIDGVIFCNINPSNDAEAMKDLLPRSLPMVALSGSLEGVSNFRVDTHAAFNHLTQYHLALGSYRLIYLSMFRDAGMVASPGWSTQDRATGFAQAIHEAGGMLIADEFVQELLEIPRCRAHLPQDFKGIVGEIIYPVKTACLTNAYENGFYQMLHLISREDAFDSLICANDDIALGALAACADRGIYVPEKIRVSGYDDTSAGQFSMIPLTTVRQPLDELAHKTVESLLSRIQAPEKSASSDTCLLPSQIIIRRSTASLEENQYLEDRGFFESTDGRVHFEFSSETDRSKQLTLDSDAPFHLNPNPKIRPEQTI